MVTTTAPRSHRSAARERLNSYLPVAATAALSVGVLILASLLELGPVAWVEAGALIACTLIGWRVTYQARTNAREWAKLRAEYERSQAAR